jgi:hypothetical protein
MRTPTLLGNPPRAQRASHARPSGVHRLRHRTVGVEMELCVEEKMEIWLHIGFYFVGRGLAGLVLEGLHSRG